MARKKKRNRNKNNKSNNNQNNEQINNANIVHYLFKPIDTWFFKESRSMDSSGSNMLISLFPPPNKTLFGAIRTLMGENYFNNLNEKNKDKSNIANINWSNFKQGEGLSKIIGYGEDYARLKTQGAWLYNSTEKQRQLYFPSPANLLRQGAETENGFAFFTLGKEVECDLGTIKFAQLDFNKDQSPLENHYISCLEFNKVLNGQVPISTITITDIVRKEPRLGIKRESQTHNVEKGMLYQTEHIRIQSDWSVYLGLNTTFKKYLPAKKSTTTLRLGGEARMASLTNDTRVSLPTAPAINSHDNISGLIIYLMTPMPDYRSNCESPPMPIRTFKKNNDGVWQGSISINEINVEIVVETAIIGKLLRLGGWDMMKHQPQAVKSYIPAGSCWYIKTSNKEHAQAIVKNLHNAFLTTGSDRALGYGQIAIGIQPQNTKDEK